MSESLTCENCRFFQPMSYLIHGDGQCRAKPPTVEGFPQVKRATWCGQHQPGKSFTDRLHSKGSE